MKAFKKFIALCLAAMTAVSAMSITALAASGNDIVLKHEIDTFYTMQHVLTYNVETGEFDSSYEPIPEVEPANVPGRAFRFNQILNARIDRTLFLRDIDNDTEIYSLGDDDTVVIRLEDKPEQNLFVQLYTVDGQAWGPGDKITTAKTILKLSGANKFYDQFGNCKIKMTPMENEYNTEVVVGTVDET